MRQIILGYQTGAADARLRTNAGNISLQAGEELSLELSADRYCVGYDRPEGGHENCPNDDIAMQGAQCLECLEAGHTRECVRCIGRMCRNPHRREKCVFSDHYVYMAYYTDELVKVGVTRIDRFPTRIQEQGAVGAVAIAGAGGQEVRRIENEIGLAGWRDRTNLLPLLTERIPSREEVKTALEREVAKINSRLPSIGAVYGKEVWMGDLLPAALPLPPRSIDPRVDPVAGTILGSRGNYLLLQMGQETVVCSMRALVGREVMTTESEKQGLAQGALF